MFSAGAGAVENSIGEPPSETANRWVENKLLNEAAGLHRDGRFDAALAAYHELLDQNQIGRTHSEALRRTAKLHRQLAQFPEARRLFQEFLAQYPDSVHAAEVMSEQAWIGVQTGNFDAAATKFQNLHENFPQSAHALEAAYWLATAAADKKEGAEATRYVDWLLGEFSKLADPQPQMLWESALWESALLLKCQLAAAGNQWQEINDLLEQEGNKFDEGSRKTRAIFWLAEAKFRTGHSKEALALFDSLAEQTKNSEQPWMAMVPLRRAQLRSRRQQWTEVLKILKEAGDFRLEAGGKEKDIFPTASGLKPTASFPLQYEIDYLRGRAYTGRGEMTLARRNYHRVLNSEAAKDTTTATMAQWMIGETFFHQNDYPRARLAYRKVVDRQAKPEWQAKATLQADKCLELEKELSAISSQPEKIQN